MISSNTLLSSIDALVQEAKKSNNEQHLREQLAAIRALCDVVLQSEMQSPGRTQDVHVQEQSTLHRNPVSGTSDKLQEQDANGDSIFDF